MEQNQILPSWVFVKCGIFKALGHSQEVSMKYKLTKRTLLISHFYFNDNL